MLYEVTRVPDTEIRVIDVSFATLDDAKLRGRPNELPISFASPDAAAGNLPTGSAQNHARVNGIPAEPRGHGRPDRADRGPIGHIDVKPTRPTTDPLEN